MAIIDCSYCLLESNKSDYQTNPMPSHLTLDNILCVIVGEKSVGR